MILNDKQARFIVETTDWSYGTLDMKIKYTLSILAVVFSFVSMGIAIAAKIVSRKYAIYGESCFFLRKTSLSLLKSA